MKCWMCIGVLSVVGLGGATWAGIGAVKPASATLQPGECRIECMDAAGNVQECVVTCDPACPPDCLPDCLPDCVKDCAPEECEPSGCTTTGAAAEGGCSAPVEQVADVMVDDC